MLIRIGYDFVYECAAPTPMVLLLNVHHSRAGDVVVPDTLVSTPTVPVSTYRDRYGNWCSRLVAPGGQFRITADGTVRDSGTPDEVAREARQRAVQDLPVETLQFLLASRYCEADLLANVAWKRFGGTPEGWPRVQAVCDFVHAWVTFGYEHARSTKTARDVYQERVGVCRDFAHLAIALCRSLNIPARYCTGYLSDIGTSTPDAEGDFAAWFEAFLDGRWYTFDPRNNVPRVGRVLVARGLDAADVPLSHSFGSNTLTRFKVWTRPVGTLEPAQPGLV